MQPTIPVIPTEWQQFNESLEVLHRWTADDDWYSSLAFDMALNLELESWVIEAIQHASVAKQGETKLTEWLERLRHSTLHTLNVARATEDPLSRWYWYRQAYAKYGFIETVVEASSLSDIVIKKVFEMLGVNPLEKLRAIDRANPSSLTDFHFEEIQLDRAILTSPAVQDYLLLKKWQDNQNEFHYSVIYPEFKAARSEFDDYRNTKWPDLAEQTSRDALAGILLSQQQLIRIEAVARLLKAGIGKALTAVVGGKALGLAKLLLQGRTVPQTWIIPVGALSDEITATPFLKGRWAVRSSATVEDAEEASFAGIFNSKLDVPGNEIWAAVKHVQEAVSGDRVESYVNHFKTKNPKMAVIVQEFRMPQFAGVWMGKSLAGGLQEWVKGTGEKLVSGQVTPTAEIWENGIGPDNALESSSGAIGSECIKFQQEVESLADLEWAVVDNQLLWLQYRPVTRAVSTVIRTANPVAGSLIGIAASPGQSSGPACVLEDVDTSLWARDSVLVAPSTDPDWVPIMTTAAAVVTAQGGILSHAAIIARELGIPCVTGVQEAMEIPSGRILEVDGGQGLVRVQAK